MGRRTGGARGAGDGGRWRLLVPAFLVAVAMLAAGCSDGDDGDDGGDAAGPATTAAAGADDGGAGTSTTATVAAEDLTVLVTNDDGYRAEGIDVLVEALSGLDGIEVVVYAPLDQRSGSGGTSTEGPLEVTDVALPGGHPARAVDGFPADTVRVAIDDEGVAPDLVVSGINEGQNIGPLVDISGTVGAARAAARRGVPALAVSQGVDGFDYEAAVPLVLDWVREQRAALAAGEAPVQVVNLNVPSCGDDPVRGLLEVEPDPQADVGLALGPQDCTSGGDVTAAAGDVSAFVEGYATLSTVPAEPATPAEVVPAG